MNKPLPVVSVNSFLFKNVNAVTVNSVTFKNTIDNGGYQTWGNCNSNCNVIVMNYIFKVMKSNL